ncbi:hypothetical protein AB0D12_31090 [Streptomyces sp. NPDC048479]|uniref:hypothetical protein n=1 Tax=Streptomyces sp. NPDC048479 TaxID=3154725 RepID=UPI0034188C05
MPKGGALLVGATLLAALAGCGESRDYAVPNKACGVSVDAGLLAPLLPKGDKLQVKDTDQGSESPRCRLLVDNRLAVDLRGDVVPADTDPIQANSQGLARLGNPAKADIGDDARIADRGAMSVGACTYKGVRRKLAVEVELKGEVPDDTQERRRMLSDFLKSYLPEALQAQGCTE